MKRAQGVTTISQHSLEVLRQFGFHGPCQLVYPGVDCQRYSPGPDSDVLKQWGLTPRGPVLVTLGRLMKRKAHDRVISVLPQLLAEFPELCYVIAGIGPEESRLKALTRRLGLEKHVHFLGKISDEAAPQLLRQSTLFVHPNVTTETGDVEGFGIVFLEAAACAIPTIGGLSGGTADSVEDGRTGLLVDGNDADQLREAIAGLLRDPARCLQMGQAGRRFAEKFDWGVPAAKVWELSVEAQSG